MGTGKAKGGTERGKLTTNMERGRAGGTTTAARGRAVAIELHLGKVIVSETIGAVITTEITIVVVVPSRLRKMTTTRVQA
jgi:hypothetical protein